MLAATKNLTASKHVKAKRGCICIQFDDGPRTDFSIAYKSMKERSWRGASYINGAHINDWAEYLQWHLVKIMSGDAWDVQCHAWRHDDLTTKDNNTVNNYMIWQDNIFNQYGIPVANHHAYPYGANDQRVIDIVKQYRSTMRTTRPEVITYEQFNPHDLPGCSGDIYLQWQFDVAKSRIDDAVNNDKIYILFYHDIRSERVSWWHMLLNYIQEKKLRVVTISELYEELNNLSMFN